MQVRFSISSTSISSQSVTPIWKGDIGWRRDKDSVFYEKELKSELVFVGADYQLITAVVSACEKITVTIEVLCGTSWTVEYQGAFTKFDGKEDKDKCAFRVTPKITDTLKCLCSEWEDETEIYAGTGAVITTKAFGGTYEAGHGISQCCRTVYDPSPCDQFNSLATGWCHEETTVTQQPSNAGFCANQFLAVSSYHRVTDTGTPTTPPTHGTGWTLLSGSTWWRCPTFSEIKIGVLKYGRRLDQVLQKMVNSTGCGLTLRSHFFAINNTHAAAPTNTPYTYAADNLRNITVHQKSDVKRPYDSNAAFSWVWKMKLKDLLDDLRTIFNLYWKIEGSSLILEHISYFAALSGADFTAAQMKKQLEGDIDTPEKETFVWADADAYPTFQGQVITYDCGSGSKEYRVNLFSTDLQFIRDEANAARIADAGFCLVANSIDGGGNYWVKEANYALSWQYLHENLHRHNRPFGAGKMNGTATTFASAQTNRKQESFTVPNCCTDNFDPAKTVTTALGQGQVVTATKNLYKDTLTLELAY